MIAIIRMPAYKLQVNVRDYFIDSPGYVRIEAEDGTIYETHLANVLLIDERGKK